VRILRVGLLSAAAAFAHTGERLQPHDLWTAWAFEPGVVLPLLLSALLYARGARRSRGVTPLQQVYFWIGWTVLALSLISPLHALGGVLFSAHMAQHEILMLVAAPLLVLSRPLVPFLWGLPFTWRRTAGQWSKAAVTQKLWTWLTAPFVAWTIHAIALWVWHAPPLLQATITSELVHSAQHASFLFSALLFWWALFFGHGALGYGMGVVYVFTTAIHTGALGALLTFAPSLWYPEYGQTAPAWGMSGLEDQQIGGLIMWVPAGAVYTIAGLALFAAWLRQSDGIQAAREYAE
jgi:putative membrane protein